MHITLKDGTFIYTQDMLESYLISLGFDLKDLDLKPDISNYVLKDDVDNWELIADGYFTNHADMCAEIESICDKLASGKGGTKKEYAARIKEILRREL